MQDDDQIRHSHADELEVDHDPEIIARQEAANALRQATLVRTKVEEAARTGQRRLRPATILELNRSAIGGLSRYAGVWRPGPVRIEKAEHTPPDAGIVPYLIEDMCDYINEAWSDKSPVHLAAYVMWRLNWIHPFFDGNGRTARATSYYVLCLRLGYALPGTLTIPEQIVKNRLPYYDALECADRVCSRDGPTAENVVAEMESLLAAMLATQLKSAFDEAVVQQSSHASESERLIKSLSDEAQETADVVESLYRSIKRDDGEPTR